MHGPEERQTGRGSDGLARGGEYRCRTDETSRERPAERAKEKELEERWNMAAKAENSEEKEPRYDEGEARVQVDPKEGEAEEKKKGTR